MAQLKCLFWILICIPPQLFASFVAVVETVQQQVTLERHAVQYLLTSGTKLRQGDKITTGSQARVVIRFFDQSIIRLGAHTDFQIEQLSPPAKNNKILRGVFNILQGIVRFTSQQNKKHDVQVHVGHSIALGIRGTDVFAKVDRDKDIVCLVQGKVRVRSGNVKAVLSKYRHFFVVPKDQPPQPVGFIEEDKLHWWMEMTQ